MLRKDILTPQQAVEHISDGMTLMVGGFMTVGTAEKLIDALVEKNVRNLTIICNDAGLPNKGVGKLIKNGQVSRLIASHIGLNRYAGEQMNSGEMEVSLIPQGTLIEQIRAGGAGLGGVLTKTGLNTLIEAGKQTVIVGDEKFLIEARIQADFSLIRTHQTDEFGNSNFNKTAANFNPVMATAGKTVIAQADEIIEYDAVEASTFTLPSVLIDFIVE